MSAKYTAPREIADAINAALDRAASVSELAALIARLPGVTAASPASGHQDRISIQATGTRCGTLDRPYTIPFLLDAFGIEREPQVNAELDAAIERQHARLRERAEAVERDGFDRAVDRTIEHDGFVASVEPCGYGEIRVAVSARLKGGAMRSLGEVTLVPQATRGEVLRLALSELGYERNLDMDADDGSMRPNRALRGLLSEMGQ